MSINKYIISIIIPTKNRQKYALKAIEQILSIESDNIQLVIQDNSDKDSLRMEISKFDGDNRLKYNYTNKILSFVDNFSEAVSLADGEYICMIGDDDGIMPDILKIVEWAKDNNIDAISPSINAVYIWPSEKKLMDNTENGYMCITYISDRVEFCDTSLAIKKLMSFGGQKYLTTDMVKLYHGVVKKECMEKIRSMTGRYFGGLTPDIYASVALSVVSDRVVKINYPITISGICNTSGSADSVTGKHTGELKDAPHFKGHIKYDWSNEVPKFYSVETIWADTALHVLRDLNKSQYIKNFNVAAINMYCLNKYPEFKAIIKEHSDLYKIGNYKVLIEYLRLPVLDLFKRIVRRVTRKKNDVIKIYNIKDIKVAQEIVLNNLDNIGVSSEKVLKNLDTLVRR